MTASAFEAWTLAAGIEATLIGVEVSTGHNVAFANRPLNAVEREAGVRFADLEAIVEVNTTQGTDMVEVLFGAAAAALVVELFGAEDTTGEDIVETTAAIAILLLLYSKTPDTYTRAVEKTLPDLLALVRDSYTGGVLTVLDEATHQGINTDRWVPPRVPPVVGTMASGVAAHPLRRVIDALLRELQTPRRAAAGHISRGELLGFITDTSRKGTLDLLHQANQTAMGIGRLDMADRYPGVYIRAWASEVMDRATCGPCKAIDGKRFTTMAEAVAAYGTGGYVRCEGGSRCRGVAVFLFNPPRA